jgi:hypothetical protein
VGVAVNNRRCVVDWIYAGFFHGSCMVFAHGARRRFASLCVSHERLHSSQLHLLLPSREVPPLCETALRQWSTNISHLLTLLRHYQPRLVDLATSDIRNRLRHCKRLPFEHPTISVTWWLSGSESPSTQVSTDRRPLLHRQSHLCHTQVSLRDRPDLLLQLRRVSGQEILYAPLSLSSQ